MGVTNSPAEASPGRIVLLDIKGYVPESPVPLDLKCDPVALMEFIYSRAEHFERGDRRAA
jgi:hypothetical protein